VPGKNRLHVRSKKRMSEKSRKTEHGCSKSGKKKEEEKSIMFWAVAHQCVGGQGNGETQTDGGSGGMSGGVANKAILGEERRKQQERD